jgi:hypothetical protein
MATILDGEGNELAVAVVSAGEETGGLAVERVLQGKGRLLEYYFGRGLRTVLVDCGEFRLRGTLQTRWLGQERLWQVRLNPLVETASAVRAAVEASA